jgi:hypothetical protein
MPLKVWFFYEALIGTRPAVCLQTGFLLSVTLPPVFYSVFQLSKVRECEVQWGAPHLTVLHTLEKGYISCYSVSQLNEVRRWKRAIYQSDLQNFDSPLLPVDADFLSIFE